MATLRQFTVAVILLAALSASHAEAKRRGQVKSVDALYDGLAPSVVFIDVLRATGRGLGSGVLLHADGYVATAAHVVERAASIMVLFKDGSKQKGRIVTLSRTEDLALIKIDSVPKSAFIPALADSDELKVGQPIFCIGAPLGLRHTLTTGIVSAVRTEHGSELSFYPKHVIQTDAAINQGNSGGALFNERGEVVGIASFIATQSGGNVGLGFAVPSNTVRRRLFDRPIPYVGLLLRRVPKPLGTLLHWPYDGPLLVEGVEPRSPAAAAGMRGGYVATDFQGVKLLMGGDLIVKVGGFAPSQSEEVHALLEKLKEGDTIPYMVLREGRLVPIDVKIGPGLVIPKLAPLKAKGRKKR